MSSFVISLDFEMLWGVISSRTVSNYRKNIEMEWEVIPNLLKLFRKYDIRATWATVGMLMCNDFKQWNEIRPSIMPGYFRQQNSTYSYSKIVRENSKLFFGKPLVEQILATSGQELASHTYSHFFCDEEGATPQQFTSDLECFKYISSEMGVTCRSIVFPRNQVKGEFINELKKGSIDIYRGNPKSWLYRNGHLVPFGKLGRALRYMDSWIPLSSINPKQLETRYDILSVPASFFLRPWISKLAIFEPIRLNRLKQCMLKAAIDGGICHIWWHPHNFGNNQQQNLKGLEELLRYFSSLRDQYGMSSQCMSDFRSEIKNESINFRKK